MPFVPHPWRSMSARCYESMRRLSLLRMAADDERQMCLKRWLEIATPGEVRKFWEARFGRMPSKYRKP